MCTGRVRVIRLVTQSLIPIPRVPVSYLSIYIDIVKYSVEGGLVIPILSITFICVVPVIVMEVLLHAILKIRLTITFFMNDITKSVGVH